uniref:Uncharacterized protein n=1 Tax=Arundo donax TaxID=35708 RepID=A0A0A8Z4L5_ARUDO
MVSGAFDFGRSCS